MDSVNDSLAYYIALKKAGVPVEMHLYAQGGHAFGLRRYEVPDHGMASVGGDMAGDHRDNFRVDALLAYDGRVAFLRMALKLSR